MRGDFEAYLSRIDLQMLLAWEDEASIDFAVVMPPTEVEPQNLWLAQQIAGNKRCIGCALVNPHFGQRAVDEVRRAVTEWGFKGIKLMPVIHKYHVDDASLVDPLMQTAKELGIVVSIHSGNDDWCRPFRIGNLASRFPDVPIIMDHMGFPDHLQEAIEAAKRNSNLYMGTTILRFHKRWGDNPDEVVPHEVKQAVDELGPERIVFGSNLPEYRPIQVMRALQRLELGKAAESLIFGENLARLYQLQA